jgi:hypothetical protein
MSRRKVDIRATSADRYRAYMEICARQPVHSLGQPNLHSQLAVLSPAPPIGCGRAAVHNGKWSFSAGSVALKAGPARLFSISHFMGFARRS